MSIIIACRCGKRYSVRDEFAGKSIQCPACNEIITVPEADTAPEQPENIPVEGAETTQPEDTSVPQAYCSSCGANILENSVMCASCGKASPKTAERYIDRLSDGLDEYLNDPEVVAADERLKKWFFSTQTYVLAAVVAVSFIMFFAGLIMRNDAGIVFAGFGIAVFIILGIALLVSFVRDFQASHIQDASTPEKAFRRFIGAISSGRSQKAFCALAPDARERGAVETIGFKKFASTDGEYSISDAGSFKKYWRSILKGPFGQQRTVTLKKVVRVEKIGKDMVILKADFYCTAYPSWYIAFMFIALLIAAIVMTMAQSNNKETKTVTKLLVRRNGRWFIADGEFEGIHDKAAHLVRIRQ